MPTADRGVLVIVLFTSQRSGFEYPIRMFDSTFLQHLFRSVIADVERPSDSERPVYLWALVDTIDALGAPEGGRRYI